MKKLSFSLAFLTVLFFCNCKKSSTDISENLLELKGGVLLFDEGNKMVDRSGMTVSIENTNPFVSTTTGTEGDFTLKVDPSQQSFALIFSKPEFGTFKRYFTKESSGELFMLDFNDIKRKAGYIGESLGSKSSVTINSFNVAIVNGKLRFSSNVSSPNETGEKFIRVIFQKDLPNISMSTVDNKSTLNWSYKWAVKNGDNVIDLCLDCSMVCTEWTKGDRIFFNAYGDAAYSNGYIDQSSKTLILPNIKLNNLSPVSVVIP